MESLQLQDIHLPESASFWPLALGWWILIAVIIFMAVWAITKVVKRIKQKRQQRRILAKFKALEKKLKANPSNTIVAEINTLLRQLAITYYPRTEIASLTGGDWLHFLDKSGGTHDFSRGAGRILIDAPYRHGELQNLNLDEFTPLIRSWIKKTITHKTRISDSSRLTDELSLAERSETTALADPKGEVVNRIKKGGGVS